MILCFFRVAEKTFFVIFLNNENIILTQELDEGSDQ